MNRKLKLIALGLVLTIYSANSIGVGCPPSGFGVALVGNISKPKIKVDPSTLKAGHSEAENNKKTQVKKDLKATQAKTAKKADDATKFKKDSNIKVTVSGYTLNAIGTVANNTTLPNEKTTINLDGLKYDGDNTITRYRIFTAKTGNDLTKYNDNGWPDQNNGTKTIENMPILVVPGILAQNNYTFAGTSGNYTTNTAADYARLAYTNDVSKDIYLTPYDWAILRDMNSNITADTVPTHVSINELESSDPITGRFIKALWNNQTTKDTWTGSSNILDYKGDLFFNSAKQSDWGLNETSVDSLLNTLTGSATSQNFSDTSKWKFDLALQIFYQYRVFDWFFRVGIFGSFPIVNKEISLVKDSNSGSDDNSKDKKNKSSSTDFSLKHKFDMGAQLLVGYNITTQLALVLGCEAVYHKYSLQNLDKFYAAYQCNSVLSNLCGEAVNNDWQKKYGNDGSKTKEFGKWTVNGVVGLEFNFGKFMVGGYLSFGPNIKLVDPKSEKSFGTITISNLRLRLAVGMVF